MKQLRIAFGLLCVLAAFTSLGPFQRSIAREPYSADHPEIKEMVNRAVGFLGSSSAGAGHVGPEYEILVGYSVYKATENHDHPLVTHAVTAAQKLVREFSDRKSEIYKGTYAIYQISITAVFLAALDGEKFKSELEQCRDILVSIQKPSGGFGYLFHAWFLESRGDISQTQYVTLALWSIKQAKVDLDMKMLEKTCLWLRDEQHADGGWSYQAMANPTGTHGVTTQTMLAAGLSAILLSADAMDVMRGTKVKLVNSSADVQEEEEPEIPEVFARVSDEEAAGRKAKKPISKAVSRDMLKKVAQNAAKWVENHPYKREGASEWYYYNLYSVERYQSFLEILEGRREVEPAWYREGVETLKTYQDPATGGFGVLPISQDKGGAQAATCFSILFLLRTTQKAIGDLKESNNKGGQGLGNVADVAKIDGKVVDKSKITNVDEMLKMLESNKEGSPDDKQLADRIPLESDPKARKEQLNRFSRMLRSPSYSSRALASKILGRGDDLDYVPDLIYALSDPDSRVPLIAENSLRILSRQMTSFALPNDRLITADDRVKAERRWQQWYLSVRPDYRFISN